jgi:hypothetical protein
MAIPAFVPGEPVLSGGRGQDEWQELIRASAGISLESPMLTFIVSSIRRRGHPFDLDNLVHPVLMVFDEPIDRVAARLYVGDPPGLLIEDGSPDPPPSDCVHSIYVPSHSNVSSRGRTGIPEIADDAVCIEHDGVGLSLAFDRADIPIRKGWFGPTEAVIDDLIPWLGIYTTGGLIADHRIRDLRIERGVNPTSQGVHIRLWYVPDDSIPVQPSILERMGAPGAGHLDL